VEVEMKEANKKLSILQLIERKFAKFRIEKPGTKNGYPANLKRLIGSNKARGLSVIEISNAAKVTPKTVRDWQTLVKSKSKDTSKQLKLKPLKDLVPKQLKVIGDFAGHEQIVGRSEERREVRINLRNGVVIEIFATDLSTSLLSTLCGLEVGQC
jgi:hypothetical protein